MQQDSAREALPGARLLEAVRLRDAVNTRRQAIMECTSASNCASVDFVLHVAPAISHGHVSHPYYVKANPCANPVRDVP